MHPAYSVIAFTTASGAGYGLLIWLMVLALAGAIPVALDVGLAGFGIAFTLITAGLLSSTFHLGRPERAWRAVTQWRSSWLSREGVLALATYVPAGIVALAWVGWGAFGGIYAGLAVATVVLALATAWSTGMIYASLPTVRAWAQPQVAPLYVALALGTGGLLCNALLAVLTLYASWMAWLPALPLLAAWLLKTAYWERIDTTPKDFTIEQATGLGRFGQVRQLDPPHTQSNYVMREMGYAIARKHAEKLRRLVVLALFLVPCAASVLAIVAEGSALLAPLLLLAVLSGVAGVLTERWLFFAEAEHVSMLYYGRKAA